MSSYQLAQLNLAKMKFAIDEPEMADFVNNLDVINQLADQSPGFVWRLIPDKGSVETEQGVATGIDFWGNNVLVNMSIWKDVESLHNYVYRTAHTKNNESPKGVV